MGWQEVNKMDLRREFISAYLERDITMKALCERYKISRETGYKLIRRYKALGVEVAIQDESRRPKHTPGETSEALISHILRIREEHPCWGGRKIKAVLEREGISEVPAVSTISTILKKRGYIDACKTKQTHFKRFEREGPNQLWQADFKGHFAYEQGRCHPLTILDDHSRFSIILEACTNERETTVRALFIKAFERYGLPEQMNFDNGPPWGSIFRVCRYTTLSIWLIEHGVRVTYSRPAHPQTNGKDERFHRTLKLELLSSNYFKDLVNIQRAMSDWREVYNHKRPHEALGMKVPADRYKVSYRGYEDAVNPYEYDDDYRVKRADKRGRLHFEGRTFFIGVPFSQKLIGMRRSEVDGEHVIFYRHQKLATINSNEVKKGTGINVYSGNSLAV